MFRIEGRRAAGVVAAGAVVIGTAGGAAWGASHGGSPTAVEQTRSSNTATSYVTGRQEVDQAKGSDEAITTTLAGLDSDVLTDVSIGAAPSADSRQGPWFYATINPGSDVDVPVPVSLWEADLAQGAIAERLASGEGNLANVVFGSTFDSTSPDGDQLSLNGGAGDIEAGQAFAANAESDASIEEAVAKVAAEFGLEHAKVRVLHALDPAVLLTAEVTEPQVIAGKFDALRSAVLGKSVRYEGVYIRIDSSTAGPLVVGSTAYRSGAGRLWIRPKYDEIIGAVHGGGPSSGSHAGGS